MEESSRLRGGVAISFDQEVGKEVDKMVGKEVDKVMGKEMGKEVDKVGEVMDIGQGGEWLVANYFRQTLRGSKFVFQPQHFM